MEKCEKPAGDGEFPFPEAIIQRIQSFLDTKQSAQTALLSTSWYSAWSTRPNLDFDQRHFRRRSDVRFSDFTMKTMQRYEDLKLNIETFRLEMRGADDHDQSLAKELIVKAMKLRAVDLKVGFVTAYPTSFVLPDEVLGSETLVRLSVTGCVIDAGSNVEVACAKLKSLNLFGVIIINGDIVRDLIPRLPLIEKLILCRRDEISNHTYYGRLELSPFSDSPINVVECQELKYVSFDIVSYDVLFFHEFH